MARTYKQNHYGIIVLDPQRDPDWFSIADFCTDNREQFLETFWKSKNCKVFVDECQDVMDNHDKEMAAIIKRGRHNGHQVFLISQRPKSIPVNVRSQCSKIITFRQAREEAKIMANEIGNDEFRRASELGRYEFLSGDNFSCDGPLTI